MNTHKNTDRNEFNESHTYEGKNSSQSLNTTKIPYEYFMGDKIVIPIEQPYASKSNPSDMIAIQNVLFELA